MKSLFQSIPEPDLLSGNSSRDKGEKNVKGKKKEDEETKLHEETTDGFVLPF